MYRDKNPFEYEGANNLSEDDLIDFYIEDYNYSRFIQSTRNIMLEGERGSGKTMTLLYNSFKIQYKRAKKNNEQILFDKIGVHIPCNTPLFHKKEYLLAEDDFKKSVLCEHYLVLSMISAISEALSNIKEIDTALPPISENLFGEMEYLLDIQLDRDNSFFVAINQFVLRESIRTQGQVNSGNIDVIYDRAFSFSSIVIPFLHVIRRIPILQNVHFLLMLDDAHDMNKYQIQVMNSWIAYRDHSSFSFKVATAKVNRPNRVTSTGSSILEGHDFTVIDMQKSFQNEKSDFYKLAEEIIKKRLENIGLNGVTAEDFFPTNPRLLEDMEVSKDKAIEAAKSKYPDGPEKSITDYVYKYKRVAYFRDRSSKANKPPYSGFETIVDISTGIIRNLLDPCYWMYDSALNQNTEDDIRNILPKIQTEVIVDRSKRLWDVIGDGLNRVVDNCSAEQASFIKNLFEQLMILFKRRLLEHKSEPRAIVFVVSQKKQNIELYAELIELLNIAQRAQLLYTRRASSKDIGKQETYYIPNRMLMPSRGLDPHGQYSHVSLKVTDLMNAARKNQPIPFSVDDDNTTISQGKLFEDE